MVAISTVIGGLSLLPEIVSGVDSLLGLFRNGGNGGGAVVPQDLRGGLPPISSAQAGTSVGPLIDVAVTAIPPIIAAVQAVRQNPAVGGFGTPQIGTGRTSVAGRGLQTMTRKQFILATARAANPGATAKKIIRSARLCGLELAAVTFGLNVLDVCFLIAQPATRRARGISAADLRRTRATVRKVHNIEADFREWCKPTVRRRRSK